MQVGAAVDIRTLALSFGVFLAFAMPRAAATVPVDGLEKYAYKDMTLLKVIRRDGQEGAACFFASHNYAKGGVYVWVRLNEAVGDRNGTLVKILKDRVEIHEVQAVNGKDWIPISFLWPLATGDVAKKLALGCGLGPKL